MRFKPAAGLLLIALLIGGEAPAVAPPQEAGPHPPPARAAVRAAVRELQRDPNLGIRHTLRRLRWVSSTSPPPAAAPPWIVGLFEFLGQGLRLLLWIGGAIVFAIAAVWGVRLLNSRGPRAPNARAAPASHLGPLDLRPESLPDDVGAAALALVEAGRPREALSLLYRGALSRAVHRFGVAIAASFTESEALEAVRTGLEAPRADYVREIVSQRREAVYAGRALVPGAVADLCRQFSPAFGGRAP